MSYNNLQLFESCLQYDEKIIDHNSYYNNIVLSREDILNIQSYTNLSQEIKNKIIAIKEIGDIPWSESQIYKLIEQIIDNLLLEGAQYNEFSCFLHACDITIDTITEVKKTNPKLLQEIMLWIIDEYRNNRKFLDNASIERTTALYDDSASRRKWKAWELKIWAILWKKWFIQSQTWENFLESGKAFFFFDTGKWKFNANQTRRQLQIIYQFNKDHKKTSDVCIKFKNQFYILEAKHLKEWWWSQDKQFQELLDLISYDENNISYIWFLDWAYRNFLLKSNSLYKQTEKTRIDNIKESLQKHTNNYFVNTYGLEYLFSQE